ncbi:MAG: class I SAM-dependent methyltransferase, partial [Acidobacteria bacterium]|nr:class I SAM-dependent methyltransferase [Acidobacteriota bacterium]
MTDYESRAANERAHNKHVAESAAALSSEDVARFAPAVPAFEFAFEIYYRYLDRRMPNRKLDEYVLARQARSPRSLRLLSLGCGTGDWEIDVARRSGGRLAVTLADLTPELLEKAADAGRREDLNVETKVCDVNEILLPERAFDFIVCRSSLHHFLKLEHVFDQINRGLTAEGRFLVLGEWVGRNGLQYYPQAERIIQAIFQALPARLRLNRYTNETDSRIPSIDFGANSFEAIRSQEIVGLLMERFDPVEHVLYDGIVTPLL